MPRLLDIVTVKVTETINLTEGNRLIKGQCYQALYVDPPQFEGDTKCYVIALKDTLHRVRSKFLEQISLVSK